MAKFQEAKGLEVNCIPVHTCKDRPKYLWPETTLKSHLKASMCTRYGLLGDDLSTHRRVLQSIANCSIMSKPHVIERAQDSRYFHNGWLNTPGMVSLQFPPRLLLLWWWIALCCQTLHCVECGGKHYLNSSCPALLSTYHCITQEGTWSKHSIDGPIQNEIDSVGLVLYEGHTQLSKLM